MLKLFAYSSGAARLLVSIFCFFLFTPLKSQTPKILHFGWDCPGVERLYDSIGLMQNTAFDGICISFQEYIMEAFDTTVQDASYFKYDKLRCIKWGKYTDNYLFLRGMAKTGGSWFNDKAWISISKNMRGISKALKEGRLKGILFDSEYYYPDSINNPWTYNRAQYPNHSFSEVQDKVRERGKQFIRSLQTTTNEFSILSIWLTGLIVDEMKFVPFEKTRFALLIAFMEGILLEKNKKVTIIDGNESAYWYCVPSQFLESTANLQKHTIALMRSAKAKKLALEIQIAQPVFYDGIIVTSKEFERGFKNLPKWNWLQENLKYALATSNSNTVWFYNERLNWKNKLNDTLVRILGNSKLHFSAPHNDQVNKVNNILTRQKDNINSAVGNYYRGFGNNPMETNGIAFNYTFNPKTKILEIKFIDIMPQSVSVFINNNRVASFKPETLQNKIKLKGFGKGILAILSKYPDGTESCALQFF